MLRDNVSGGLLTGSTAEGVRVAAAACCKCCRDVDASIEILQVQPHRQGVGLAEGPWNKRASIRHPRAAFDAACLIPACVP